jgi:hypothetical protein
MPNVWTKFADPAWQGAARIREKTDSGLTMGTSWGLGKTTQSQKKLQEKIKRIDERKKAASKRAAQKRYLRKTKCNKHPVEVREGTGPHIAEIFCIKCQKHVQWMSKQDYAIYKDLKNEI